MKKIILLSLAIAIGCFSSSKVKDYSGKKINLDEYPFAILSYKQDTFNEEIYYITYETVEISSSYQNDIDSKEEKVLDMRTKLEQEMAVEESNNETDTNESDKEVETEEGNKSEEEPEESIDKMESKEESEDSSDDTEPEEEISKKKEKKKKKSKSDIMKEQLDKAEAKLDAQKTYLKNKINKKITAVRNEIMGFCMEFGYSSYHVVEDSGWNTFMIHCHKTEDEYNKYDERYRKD